MSSTGTIFSIFPSKKQVDAGHQFIPIRGGEDDEKHSRFRLPVNAV
jgi:hypothetical protein